MFHIDGEAAPLSMKDLVDFLKTLILTTVQVDTKYREALPEIITQMATYVDSSEDGRKARRRRAKKLMRVGKNGLYPAEDELVRKWWIANKPVVGEDEESVSTQQIRSHTLLLRTRETQLQMILILEIMALEPLCQNGEGRLPGDAAPPESTFMAGPIPKKRSKHNLPVLLDLHADRLCIWQSTAFEELVQLQGSALEGEGGVQHSPNGAPGQTTSLEPLRDFCVDIIIPL